jgi:hypothetical protein
MYRPRPVVIVRPVAMILRWPINGRGPVAGPITAAVNWRSVIRPINRPAWIDDNHIPFIPITRRDAERGGT